MKKLIIVASVISSAATASADNQHIAYRESADHYSLLGEGKVRTVDCTVTAEGMEARIDTERGRAFIVFLDRDGNEEGQCELASLTLLSVPHVRLSHPRRVVAKFPVARAVKVASK